MLGEKIKQLRTELGLSQEALANKLFITQHALSQYETGKRCISDDKLLLLAEHLGVTITLLKQADYCRKPSAFYAPKAMREFETMSCEDLTEYLMKNVDEDVLCAIAGNFPFDYFIQLNYDQQYDEVLNAIYQFPWELFVDYLRDVCVEDETGFEAYMNDWTERTNKKN